MTTFEFDADTAVVPVDAGAGRWRATITPRFNVGPNPNGGYILATMLRPLFETIGKPDPLTVSAHFLRPTTVGEADIDVDVFRTGRRHAHAEVRLVQETERVRAIAAFGDLAAAEGRTLVRGAPPELPPPDECIVRRPVIDIGQPAIMDRFETRFAPSTPWILGEPSIDTAVTGWIRFADGRPADVASLPLFADAFPPAVFALGRAGWVPTIELTVHVRARPAPGWLRARFETRFLVDGYLEEDGELWDEDGRLVAESRQLAMLLQP
ncbi:MAG: hypothetical protein QOF60_3292 [Actinomycetota bacterium]|jgi:acyl-CoA thioesterase|nr:hypothetical protein [Actinomycetota bacterium]